MTVFFWGAEISFSFFILIALYLFSVLFLQNSFPLCVTHQAELNGKFSFIFYWTVGERYQWAQAIHCMSPIPHWSSIRNRITFSRIRSASYLVLHWRLQNAILVCSSYSSANTVWSSLCIHRKQIHQFVLLASLRIERNNNLCLYDYTILFELSWSGSTHLHLSLRRYSPSRSSQGA